MRIEEDVDICVKHQAPVIISSVGSPKRLIEKVHGYGGLVFSDASTVDYAKRGAQAGVDGLVLLCAGAGGNTGALNPFAFVSEVRRFFDGPIVLAGAISRGRFVRLAQEMGADMAMAGTSFIAARESLASDEYRDMLIQSGADDIVLTAEVTGIPANLLRHSLEKVGFASERGAAGFNLSHEMSVLKAWRDIWSAGHGVGDVDLVEPAAEIVARFRDDYFHAGQPRAAA
jgi:nitronate monooxygenase